VIIILKKKKTETKPKLGQTDWFRFGSLLGQKSVQTGLAQFSRFWIGFFRFWLGFFGLARFFWFGSVFFGFLSISVRFGFFSFLFIKPKPNQPVFSKI